MLCHLALVLAAGLQEPGEALRRDLTEQNPGLRREAAVAIAAMGRGAENWLAREVSKGSPGRRRALLLAAALMGTERSLALVERAVRPGGRPDQERAWALLLYGAHHPGVLEEEPRRTLRRAASDFERACLLAGLLTRAGDTDPEAWAEALGRRAREPRLRALLRMLHALVAARGQDGQQGPGEPPVGAPEAAAVLLASTLPGAAPLPAAWLEGKEMAALPEIWRVAARRVPPRKLVELRSSPAGGPGGGLAMVLYELAEDQRQDAFDLLRERLVEAGPRLWLWGAAGDLGLALPEPGEELSDPEVATLLRLAARDLETARGEARRRLPQARARFAARRPGRDHWPAALVLALAGEEEDRDRLRESLRAADPVGRLRLQPVLQLALGNLDTEEARQGWFRRWSRDLGAGYFGWFDRQGPLWIAHLLVGGTEAATQVPELSREFPALHGSRDHSRDDTLYPDLADLLLSGLYHWDLP